MCLTSLQTENQQKEHGYIDVTIKLVFVFNYDVNQMSIYSAVFQLGGRQAILWKSAPSY